MKLKTSELTGVALDWAVAKCEGVNAEAFRLYYEPTESTDFDSHGYPEFHYSTIWAQGGPIIERDRIELRGDGDEGWIASDNLNPEQYGPTPLVAAMRCYVASRLGDEVDVPDDLVWDELIYDKGDE
jgi:hypothetical protein